MGALRVAVTGSSGSVGSAVVAALTMAGCAVVRVGRDGPLGWDLRTPVPRSARAALSRADVVVHCAALIGLGAPREHLERVNADAVQDLVETLSAMRCPPRLIHMSSAFARPGDGDHQNPYEASKARAELLVRRSGLGGAIVRPSLVIGRRIDGGSARFSGIYSLLHMVVAGLLPAIPASQDARLDIIPVDVVADATVSAVRDEELGLRVVNVSAGECSPTIGRLLEAAFEVIEASPNIEFQRPAVVSPEAYARLYRPLIRPELSPAQRVLLDTLELFFPYLTRDHVFRSRIQITEDEIVECWRRSIAYWIKSSRPLQFRRSNPWGPRRAIQESDLTSSIEV